MQNKQMEKWIKWTKGVKNENENGWMVRNGSNHNKEGTKTRGIEGGKFVDF